MRGTLARFYLFRGLGLTWLYVPFQWFYLRGQGLSATELMALNTIFCAAAVFLEVPTGALADRLGRRLILGLGAMSSTLSCLAFVLLSPSFAGLAVANGLAALAMTCISGADSAYLFDLLGARGLAARYQQAESFSSAARLVAAAAGAVLATALVAWGAGLRSLYLVSALLAATAVVVAVALPSSRPRGARPAERSRIGDAVRAAFRDVCTHARRGVAIVLSRRQLLSLLALSAVLFPVLRVGLFLDQPYLHQLGFATASIGLAFACKDLAAALAASVTARLLATFGERRLLLSLPVVAGLVLLVMAVASSRAAALLVLIPTAAFGVYSPLVRVFVNRRLESSRDRATVLSVEGMARRVGFALFSPLVGAIFDLWSLSAALTMSACWAAVALVLAGVLAAVARPRKASDAGAGPASSPAPVLPTSGALSSPARSASSFSLEPGLPSSTLLSSDRTGASGCVETPRRQPQRVPR